MKNKLIKAKKISRTIYIILATVLVTTIATGLFFEKYKLQIPILIQLRAPVVERELLSPIIEIEKVEAVTTPSEVVISNDTGRSTQALRGEVQVNTRKDLEQRITGWRGITIPQADSVVLDYYGSMYDVEFNTLAKIARCESSFDPSVVGSQDDSGILQFMPKTWVETRKRMGLSTDLDLRFNLEENVRTGAYKISKDGVSAWQSSAWCHGMS